MRGGARLFAIVAATVALVPASAAASWHPGGGGSGYAVAQSLGAGNTPSVSVSNRSVTVSWSATSGGAPVAGYTVRRYNLSGVLQTIGSGCSGAISALTCTETAVSSGSWKYSVTPVQSGWHGNESAQSATAVVASPSLTLSPTTVNSLPATLTGSIQSFIDGQTVTFRLDNQTTGTVLSGSITPSPVPSSGTSSVSVTLPAGTADGSHAIYAIGDQGDVASTDVTVDTSCSSPGNQTLSASQDSYIDSLSASSNFGTQTSMFVRSAQVLVLSQREGLVQFSLPSVPARCTLTAATLKLYATSPNSGRTIDVLRLNGSWTETGVTWNNAPATTGTAASSASLSSAGFQSWDVLSEVQAMYSGTNNGFLVKDHQNSAVVSVQQTYQAREGTTDSQDPQLVLTFG